METVFNLHRPYVPRRFLYQPIVNPPNPLNPPVPPPNIQPPAADSSESIFEDQETPASVKLFGILLSIVLFVLGGAAVFYRYVYYGIIAIFAVPAGYCLIQCFKGSACTRAICRFLIRICCCQPCRKTGPSAFDDVSPVSSFDPMEAQPLLLPPTGEQMAIEQSSSVETPAAPEPTLLKSSKKKPLIVVDTSLPGPSWVNESTLQTEVVSATPKLPIKEESTTLPEPPSVDESPLLMSSKKKPLIVVDTSLPGPSWVNESTLQTELISATPQLPIEDESTTLPEPPSVNESPLLLPSNVKKPSFVVETPLPGPSNVAEAQVANSSSLQVTLHTVPSNEDEMDEKTVPKTSTLHSPTDA